MKLVPFFYGLILESNTLVALYYNVKSSGKKQRINIKEGGLLVPIHL